MSSPRANRVPERIKEILAERVTTLKDPRVGFVTITDVRTTPDFAHATVYYTVLGAQPGARSGDAGDPEQDIAEQQTAEGLASALPALRRELGQRMRLRQVPALEFVLDPVPAQGRRIEQLLNEVRTQRS